MLRLVYNGPSSLQWQEHPAPGLGSGHAALVRPVAVATCDLDALIIQGASPFEPPFPIGHECVAEVVEVGDQVTGVAAGQLASVPFQVSCGTCPSCLQGRSRNCRAVAPMSTYGFGPAVRTWGGFLSDLVCVPYADHMLVPVPAGLDPSTVASASDNISDAWRAVAPALADRPGESVLIVGGAGPGSIGLYAAGLAVVLGSESVLYVDASPQRRDTAAALGARTRADIPRRVGPYGITVDASGDPEGLAFALRSTAPDGVCTSTAIYFGQPPVLPLLEMYTKGITFRTGRANAREAMPHVLELAASGAFHPEIVTTRVADWTDAADALQANDWTKLVITRGGNQ